MATIDVIKNILEENLSIDPETVTPEATLDSLDIDSLDMVELICTLEDEEDIDFGEPDNIETVADLVAHVDALKA